jgi:hypothetical protein
MYAADRTPRNYGQLAAMQIGSFLKAGALSWRAEETAAIGQDQGCIEVDFTALPAAIKSLEAEVLQIKAAGGKARAAALQEEFVDAANNFAKLRQVIAERYQRAPRASFVYSIAM